MISSLRLEISAFMAATPLLPIGAENAIIMAFELDDL